MEMHPVYVPIGNLFKENPVYRIPKYQRTYSWEINEIEDFLHDLVSCYNERVHNGRTKPHFFGGIVTVEKRLPGSLGTFYYDIIDGQQRMVTFVILAFVIMEEYQSIFNHIETNISFSQETNLLRSRMDELQSKFIKYRIELSSKIEEIFVLELSNIDKDYFQKFISGAGFTNSQIGSHQRIFAAYNRIASKIKQLTHPDSTSLNPEIDKIANIRQIQEILYQDFTILRLSTQDQDQSYKLFHVLNNRGKHLTEGDLLRSKCLQLLEKNLQIQHQAHSLWEQILSDASIKTESYLKYVYASYEGVFPGRNSLLEDFEKLFLSVPSGLSQSDQENHLLNRTQLLASEFELARTIDQGIWPFPEKQPIQGWDRDRLEILMGKLGHKSCLPLLIATHKLDHKKFAKIVHWLDRFFFRYSIIGGQYLGELEKFYWEEAKQIRKNPDQYDISRIKSKLNNLLQQVGDDDFKSGLDKLNYEDGNFQKKNIKYFLTTLEYYLPWLKKGLSGDPVCEEKVRVFNFNELTIEHIYSKNTPLGQKISDLEPDKKHMIGNLTLLDPSDNSSSGNDRYLNKKLMYGKSNISLNKELAIDHPTWDHSAFEARTLKLKDMACKVFKI